jgi:hypothetical protein
MGRERDTQPRVEKRGKKMQTNLGASAASKLLESPFIGYNSVHENFVVTKRLKVLEKLRAKWTICDFNIFLNLLGQIHKSPPSILHNCNLLQVLSSGQHTFPFFFHVSPIGYPLTCHEYKMQELSNTIKCEWGQYFNLRGQTQVNMGLIFEIFSLWAGVKPLGWAQVSNNNTWIEEKSNSNIPSQTRNFAIVNSYFMGGNWTFVLGGFEEKRVWNLIACNSITVSLLSACPDSLVLQDGKEMNVCVVKICNDRDKFWQLF